MRVKILDVLIIYLFIILLLGIFIRNNFVDCITIISGILVIFLLQVVTPIIDNSNKRIVNFKYYIRPIFNIAIIALILVYFLLLKNRGLLAAMYLILILDILYNIFYLKSRDKNQRILLAALSTYLFILIR